MLLNQISDVDTHKFNIAVRWWVPPDNILFAYKSLKLYNWLINPQLIQYSCYGYFVCRTFNYLHFPGAGGGFMMVLASIPSSMLHLTPTYINGRYQTEAPVRVPDCIEQVRSLMDFIHLYYVHSKREILTPVKPHTTPDWSI